VLTQLPVLAQVPTSISMSPAQDAEHAALEQASGPGPMSGVEQDAEQVPVLELPLQMPDVVPQMLHVESQEPAVEQAPFAALPAAQVPTVVIEPVQNPVVDIPIPTLLVEGVQVPPAPVEMQLPAHDTHVLMEEPQQQTITDASIPVPGAQEPSVPAELANLLETTAGPVLSAEFPDIQGMDMYASNTTPDESENSQLVLTEEDLALASSGLVLGDEEIELANASMDLGGTDMSLVGEDMGIPGTELQIPAALDAAIAPAEPRAYVNAEGAQAAPGFNSSLGLSSGEGTPNAGGETDMFAFWG
jgi:hypothetical protein